MGFKCGIIGLPNVGKSTLFNALTESKKAEAANYPFATIEPNVGRVSVPDKRLKILSNISKSQIIIPTYIDFVDIAGLVKGASNGEGLGNKFLSHIKEVDTIAHVVRCFEDQNISHVNSTVNPLNDIEIINTELKLADLETLENKYFSLQKNNKVEDKELKKKILLIEKLLKKFNNDEKINNLKLEEEELRFFNSLNLITSKPTMYICNVDENSIIKGNKFSKTIKERLKKEFNKIVIVSAAIESQISEFNNEKEKIDMLNSLGLENTSLKKLIKVGYDLLNLITFFTCGPKETRAWTINQNTKAPDAAGKIHSDFKKGFIRSETISYNDFVNLQGEVACREAGKLRQEGKNYIINEGDICHFLFNN